MLKSLSQAQLAYVYKNASAYVSFSRWESFGWTLAEAYLQDLPLISADTGIVSYIKGQKGIDIYETQEELLELLSRERFEPPEYDTKVITDRATKP